MSGPVHDCDRPAVGGIGGAVAAEIRARLEPRRDDMASLLGEFVSIESPSDDPEGLCAMADRLEELFEAFGQIARWPTGEGGTSHVVVTVKGDDNAEHQGLAHTAVFGHFDTVWDKGTLQRRPFAVNDGMATGPGCFDMKGGLTLLYFALAELAALGRRPRRKLRIVLNCDEEVRSRTSRTLISAAATGAAAAFVLEAPLPGGDLKTARKGSATYHLHVDGLAAHAGIEPGKGVSAVLELARQIEALHRLNDFDRGTSVNVGVVRGGSRSNVIAAHAEADIDVRTATMEEATRMETAIRALSPTQDGAKLRIAADLSRPPMERTEASGELFERARAIAAAMGGPALNEGSTGGVSDGNLVAAMGVPTLDGLGPEGGGAHAESEHVVVESMPRRAALLAGLLAEV